MLKAELALRNELKYLYDQFILDARDNENAKRYVQQAYFSIQKERIRKLINERLEFHPFWGANLFDSQEQMDNFMENEGDSDDII